MRSRTPDDFRGICPRCYLKTAQCICAALPTISTQTEIVVIRHITERNVMSNTGRLAALVLPKCRIVDFDPSQPFVSAGVSAQDSWLLYPGQAPKPALPAPARLLILDASFRRAKRMYHRIEALHHLPQLALPAPEVVPTRLRQPTRADGMSTIEAIAGGLSLLEGPQLGADLLAVYAEFVRRADLAHGRVRQPAPQSGATSSPNFDSPHSR